jgi:hypothetical protein
MHYYESLHFSSIIGNDSLKDRRSDGLNIFLKITSGGCELKMIRGVGDSATVTNPLPTPSPYQSAANFLELP